MKKVPCTVFEKHLYELLARATACVLIWKVHLIPTAVPIDFNWDVMNGNKKLIIYLLLYSIDDDRMDFTKFGASSWSWSTSDKKIQRMTVATAPRLK